MEINSNKSMSYGSIDKGISSKYIVFCDQRAVPNRGLTPFSGLVVPIPKNQY